MMNIALHSTPLELAFFVVSLVVLGLSVWNVREASLDLTALTASRIDGNLRATAQSNVRESFFSIIGALIMVVASSLAMMLEPPPPDYAALPQSLVFLVAYIALGMTIVANNLMAQSTRRMLMAQSQRTYEVAGYTTESQDDEDTHEGAAKVTSGKRGEEARVPAPVSDAQEPAAAKATIKAAAVAAAAAIVPAATGPVTVAEAAEAKALAEKTVDAATATLEKLQDPVAAAPEPAPAAARGGNGDIIITKDLAIESLKKIDENTAAIKENTARTKVDVDKNTADLHKIKDDKKKGK